MLELDAVRASYGKVQVLQDVSLSVPDGGAVGILGANGAGKTTTLRAISGTVNVRGRITFDGIDITRSGPEKVASLGIAHVPEGRGTLPNLSVRENLRVGAYLRKDRRGIAQDIDFVLELFPHLERRIGQNASTLSGGEQQMLAIARAFMAKPRLLVLDEPSLGLAPSTSQDVYDSIQRLRDESGIAMLVVEQNANLAFRIVESATVLETGHSVLSGTVEELKGRDEIRKAYLGG
uniref:ABC transporter ATP-binding protein n=1 Tax=Microbacterium faecale TaxID=1804630 RepID=UPI003571591A